MELFASTPIDDVTVLDIATVVDMTSAAVYYHFASKEQILLEGMRQFRDVFVGEVGATPLRPRGPEVIADLLARSLSCIQRHRRPALVYFVSSIGLNLQVEALRRETRLELVQAIRPMVRAARGRLSSAEAGVIAVGLVSLIETAAASMLNDDATHRSLGARRFAEQVVATGGRIAGLTGT